MTGLKTASDSKNANERVVAVTDVTTELIKGFEDFEEYCQWRNIQFRWR